ncbi:flagellin [Salinadaptatus halalkaliphilus]|uniref:Flagellin n=1 Tax=Salinadaptatus halalkaliphilus TaxID=2419781 RepID=A0A4S3TGD4_9EURY|nr:flagellin [Salinadaptatus halalkaliphilus]THE62941.1 flagellin [Salinadaptatus halalkaliphilus]
MGFSTSGAVVVILIGFLVAVSVIVPTIFSVGASSGEAFSTQGDQLRDQVNTDIEIESFEAPVNETDDIVDSPTVNVTNTGSRTLSVSDTDVLIGGEYYSTRDVGSNSVTTVVVGDEYRSDTDAWLPGSHLEIEFSEYQLGPLDVDGYDDHDDFEEGDRIKITTEGGISDTAELTTVEETDGGAE